MRKSSRFFNSPCRSFEFMERLIDLFQPIKIAATHSLIYLRHALHFFQCISRQSLRTIPHSSVGIPFMQVFFHRGNYLYFRLVRNYLQALVLYFDGAEQFCVQITPQI